MCIEKTCTVTGRGTREADQVEPDRGAGPCGRWDSVTLSPQVAAREARAQHEQSRPTAAPSQTDAAGGLTENSSHAATAQRVPDAAAAGRGFEAFPAPRHISN